MAWTVKIAAAGVMTALSAGVLLFGPLDLAAAHPDTPATTAAAPSTLIERAGCNDPAASEAAPQEASVPDGAQVISVTVPATALIKFDEFGHVIAAWTNTGCAPRASDDLYVQHADGTIAEAPASVLAGHRWVGDFTHAGVFADQQP